jgi:hypothetical protein
VTAALAAAVFLIDSPTAPESASGRSTWIPDSADAVVLSLGDAAGALAGLAQLRETVQQRPGDAAAASRYGTLALRQYALTGDARFLGYASGALGAWRHDREPPQPVWMLRARILQAEHRFRPAADELLRMLAVHDDSAEALLLTADALRRAGEVAAAKSICLRLGLTGRALLARYCAADVLLSLGQPARAFAAISAQPVPAQHQDDALRQWGLAVKADAAAAAGETQVAEALYLEALALPDAGIALHASYADLLLDDARPRDALQALGNLPAADAVLLRRAIAAKRLQRPEAARLGQELRRRFAQADQFGVDRLHLRERAMFALFFDNDAEAALELAVANWEVQKSFEDAELLVQAATAAGELDKVRAIDRWRRQFLDAAG